MFYYRATEHGSNYILSNLTRGWTPVKLTGVGPM